MGKYGTVLIRSVIRAKHNLLCAGADCKKEIREGKPAVKEGKDIFCLACAEKQGYRPHIPFEVEPDYVICEGVNGVCADCGQEIHGALCFFRKDGGDKGTYSCEHCGTTKRGYKKGDKKIKVFKDPLKASRQAARGTARRGR